MKKTPGIPENISLTSFEQYWNDMTSQHHPVKALIQPAQISPDHAQNLRHPLSNIFLAGDLLTSTALDADQQSYVDIILRNAGRAAALLRDILVNIEAVNIESGDVGIDEYSVHELLDEVLIPLKDRFTDRNITVDKSYTSLDCKVLVDKNTIKAALRRIIINITNTIPLHNGVIKLITKTINRRCVIEIIGNGVGLNGASAKQIISTANTDKPDRIQRSYLRAFDILKSNHANVTIKSKEGKGTSFSFSFERIQ